MMNRIFMPGRGRIRILDAGSPASRLLQHGLLAVGAKSDSRYFHPPSTQRGSALFVGVFLIAVVAVLAVAVALTTVTQQTGAARAFEAEQAWYAAVGRIEAEAPGIIAVGACPGGGGQEIAGFTTTLNCAQSGIVQEGGQSYTVFSLVATAERGSAAAGNLVRRTARVQLTNAN